MKRLMAFMAAALLAVGIFFAAGSVSAADSERDGVFLHISHGEDDPHRLLMALNMANIMADDHDVLVYLDISGITAVLKDSKDITYAHFPSSKQSIKSLLEKNVVLMACPGCLKAAGKSKADLAEGIRIADKKLFFSFTKGRIVTLDY